MTPNQLRVYLSLILLSFISSAFADTWLFDFGPASQTSAPNYNNITNPGTHSVTGLVNGEGVPTTLALDITIPFNTSGTNPNGTTSPAPEAVFLPAATRDSFFGNVVSFQGQVAANAQLRLTGLDPSQVYDFTFFASRMGVTDNRQTQYKVTGATSKIGFLNAAENTAEVITLTEIAPATDGSVLVDLAPGPDNTNSTKFYYLGAMKLVSRPATCDADDASLNDTLTPYVATSEYGLGHWLYRPVGYSYKPCKKYPLLVWLHGAGETCNNASLDALVTRSSLNSPGYQIKQGTAYTNQRPFLNGLVLQPQSCSTWNANDLDILIEYIKTKVRVDEDRIYVTGLSLGGGGTWAYAASKYTKVAAIVPIAGTEQSLSSINAASHVPTWAFHNYNDTNTKGLNPETSLFRCKNYTPRECTIEHVDRMIPFAETGVMFGYSANHGATMAATDRTASLGKALPTDLLPTQWNWSNGRLPLDPAAKTVMTIFAANGHSGWSTAYNMQDMWLWLYEQKREPAPTIKINSPLVTPANIAFNSGGTIVISTKIGLTGTPLAQLGHLSVDLKALGGNHAATMAYDSTTKVYSLNYSLPAGLSPGAKAIGITAVDTNGNRTVKFLTLTLDP